MNEADSGTIAPAVLRVTSVHRPGALQFSPGEIHRHLVEWSRT